MKKVEKASILAYVINEIQSDTQMFKKHAFNVKNQYNAYRLEYFFLVVSKRI